MAATGNVNISVELLGLGKDVSFIDRFTLTNTPTRVNYGYLEQASADTEEALELGGVSTVDLIVIKAVTNDATVDTSFDTSYNAELNVPEGEICVFKPSGTVYIKNGSAGEQVILEYVVIGR
ncbi:MAG: hypothetical protein JRI56_00235 [Deltaproteobacteria bacterium]|nr:hypothetical protein [Deltaproteobacteria bacterium]